MGVGVLANVALPSFLPHSFATAVGIFLIAGIEGWFLARMLGIQFNECYRHALVANWRSTVVGIPVAWILWAVGVMPVAWGVGWLGDEPHPLWWLTMLKSVFAGGMPPMTWGEVASALAWIVTLVPFWLGSVWIERRTLWKRLPDLEREQISRAVVRGNLASYAVFLLLGIVMLASAIRWLPERRAEFENRQEGRVETFGEAEVEEKDVVEP